MNHGKKLIFFSLLYLISCKSNYPDKEYYPVDAWIQSQLAQIDSLPVAVIRYRTNENGTDTSIVDKKEFRKMAIGLLSITLNHEKIKKNFEEIVIDEGENTNISLVYTARDGSETALRKIQVNIKPGNSHPKSIYAERVDTLNKIRIIRKIIWTAGKSMTVNSSYYSEGVAVNTISESFEWGI